MTRNKPVVEKAIRAMARSAKATLAPLPSAADYKLHLNRYVKPGKIGLLCGLNAVLNVLQVDLDQQQAISVMDEAIRVASARRAFQIEKQPEVDHRSKTPG